MNRLLTKDEQLRKLVNGELFGALAARLAFGAGLQIRRGNKKLNGMQCENGQRDTYGLFVAVEYFLFDKHFEALLQLAVGHDALAGSRDGQREIPERVECYAAVPADGALQRRLELANEQVHDLRVVPSQVTLPRFQGFLGIAAITRTLEMTLLRQTSSNERHT